MVQRVLLFALTMVLAACKGGDGGGAPLPGGKGAASTDELRLTGAGATFPFPLYTKWISEFGKAHPNAKIDYQSIGSGGGIRQVTERTVDFGASDAPMNDEQIAKAPGILHVPMSLGAVAITYNLEGVPSGLKLTPAAVAGIFLGEVKSWDDPAIASENPDAKLPKKAIASVHRSDGSGTTKIFVDYLTAVSPAWKAGPGSGTSVSWPGGLGAKGNEGVAAQVKSTPGAIGYVELAYAVQNGMSVAALRNRAGKFTTPSLESTTAAAAGAAAKMPDDLRISIVDAEGEASYPIAGFTYLLVYTGQKSAAKGALLADYMRWSLDEGQKLAPPLHYAPLPDGVVAKAKAQIAKLTGPDGKALAPATK